MHQKRTDQTKLERLTTRYEPYAYALLRIVAGFLFIFHGTQKLFGFLATKPMPEVFSQQWFGGIIEVVGGTFLMLGLFTRASAFVASGMMAVAYFQFHWKLRLDDWQWLPIVNKGELAALYCFLFLFIALRGAGRWSLDGLWRRLREPSRVASAMVAAEATGAEAHARNLRSERG
jgi:putative oxidoreductase